MGDLDTDYLVIGAGAAGMAFTDALLEHTDATTITIVDRRHAPGGHWQEAYPYVRLHQPSSLYGVSSVPLGGDALDTTGTNAGFYELAGADELRAYYERVMHRHFLPTGRVRYLPCSEWSGDHDFVSRLTGEKWTARVKKKLVDTTFIQGEFPASSPPPFPVASGVRCVTPTELASLDCSPERYAIIGGGKTALDACVWLLERGVAPASIRWVRPRDAWWMNRKFQQPGALLPDFLESAALQVEAMAQAKSVDELFARLEAAGVFVRIDSNVTPTMFRGAVVSEAELTLLRRIEDVVRMGHVRAIERDAIVLEHGRVPADERTVHVHCAARGLATREPRPIFQKDRVTTRPSTWSFSCYQFAMLGVIEATIADDEIKNALCPPLAYWDTNADFVRAFGAGMALTANIAAHPALAAWNRKTRLNPMSGIAAHRDDPRVISSRERMKAHGLAAAMNLQNLL
jgi:hypothetical protein